MAKAATAVLELVEVCLCNSFGFFTFGHAVRFSLCHIGLNFGQISRFQIMAATWTCLVSSVVHMSTRAGKA